MLILRVKAISGLDLNTDHQLFSLDTPVDIINFMSCYAVVALRLLEFWIETFSTLTLCATCDITVLPTSVPYSEVN